ncbi:MAG: hypothetical protein ACM3VZ_03400 [Acidobacteriota bacterium]
MRAPSHLILFALTCTACIAQAATPALEAAPPAVVSTQAFRCQDEAGRQQYQQWPCASGANGQSLNVGDKRTDEQRAQARRMAVRDQDLARHVSFLRSQEERRSVEATGTVRRLTVAPRQATVRPTTVAQAGMVVPRKRDFRAVSPKTAHAKAGSSKAKARSSRQTG